MGVALITGGAIRIGRCIVLALARLGYDVIIHANRSQAAALTLVEEVHSMGRRASVESADLSNYDESVALATRIAAAHPKLDVLVNSAAAYEHRNFKEIQPAHLSHMLAVNLQAPFFLTQKLAPALRLAQGVVINITDMAVSHAYSGQHFFAHYLASKAALAALTKALALELAPHVRVNAVAPGPVAISAQTDTSQREDVLARIPLKREGCADDVASAVVFLTSASYMTGQTILVDGGLSVT